MKVRVDGKRVLSVAVVMPGTPASPNRTRGQHWGTIAREQNRWRDDTARAIHEAMVRAQRDGYDFGALPWIAADIILDYRFAKATRRDIPNFIAAAKGLIDGVVQGGLIKDDSSIYLDSVECHIQRRTVPTPEVEVTVRRCIH
jgi:Holliday junction resolvase RusA-like endonuclease